MLCSCSWEGMPGEAGERGGGCYAHTGRTEWMVRQVTSSGECHGERLVGFATINGSTPILAAALTWLAGLPVRRSRPLHGIDGAVVSAAVAAADAAAASLLAWKSASTTRSRTACSPLQTDLATAVGTAAASPIGAGASSENLAASAPIYDGVPAAAPSLPSGPTLGASRQIGTASAALLRIEVSVP